MSCQKIMLLWKRYLITGTFFFVYTLVTFYLSNVTTECHLELERQRTESKQPRDQPCPQVLREAAAPDTKVTRRPEVIPDKEVIGNPGFNPAQDLRVPATTDSPFQQHQNEIDVLSPSELLRPGFVPNIVYYIWCGRRWFEYHNYMSVMSVIRILRPDSLIFYYDEEPVQDFWIYNTWFKELKESYAFFMPVKLDPSQNGCQSFGVPDVNFLYQTLQNNGGIYVNEYTIFNAFPLTYRNYSFIYSLNEAGKYSFILNNRGVPIQNLLKDPKLEPYKTARLKCVSQEQFEKNPKELCISRDAVFFPKDIWTAKTNFAKLMRRHFYGSTAIREPKPSYDTLIPNIAHIVWIGGGRMDFLFYMCVVSLIYVAEVETVYIHGDYPPSGEYWDRIKDHPKVRHIYREVPKLVFGTKVNVLSHVTDVWRVDFMIKYGGIYVDTDTSFVQPLDREIRGYDAVGTYDWTYWNHPFPDTINFGVAIGKRNAQYWRLFQQSMDWFIDDDWSWNGLRQPYRIQERHPELVKIDPRLQVTCYLVKCHPTWWPDYHNESIHHLNSPSISDWRRQIFAFHWTLPTPPELEGFEHLLKSDTMFSDVGRFIFHKAGILKQDNKTVVYNNGESFKFTENGMERL